MKKIKVCMISTAAYPLFNKKCLAKHGGAEIQMYLYAKELEKDNHLDISFIVGNYNQKNIEIINKIKIYKSFNPKNNSSILKKLKWILGYFKLLKKINPDIVFTTTAGGLVGIVSIYCKIFKKSHLHRTAHKMDVDKSYVKKYGFKGRLYEFGLKNADVITVQTNELKTIFLKNYKKHAVIIKNLWKIKNFKEKKREHILWISRCEKWKRPEVFINLVSKFPREKFLMICPKEHNDEKYFFKIKQIAESYKNLTFKEHISFKEANNYFEQSKLFINTSSAEGFPNTFLQACNFKVPIISLKINPDKILEKFKLGVSCDNKFINLYNSVKLFIKNTKHRKKIQSTQHMYLKKNHDAKNNSELLRKIIYLMVK
ncbi:glycosyltransferase [Candidatus Woesearchaeota archaeon]|nr:glycosyltransferase [Candidatus Woesearchaeota archaeon]MCF7900767.1 glycosyltransferase [Candidatus Woesearchaeota archaeon]MCF8012932.1 glycosyltransferase [Candidatus Woesearchaeota archaeon]